MVLVVLLVEVPLRIGAAISTVVPPLEVVRSLPPLEVVGVLPLRIYSRVLENFQGGKQAVADMQ